MTPVVTGTLVRILGLLIVLAIAALWWKRRDQGLRVHQRDVVDLGGGQRLCEIEVDGRRLLLGIAPGAAPRLVLDLGNNGRASLTDAAPVMSSESWGMQQESRAGTRTHNEEQAA